MSSASITTTSVNQSRSLGRHAIRTLVPEVARSRTSRATKRIRRTVRANEGCAASICIALQSSSEISESTFELQQAFASITSSIIGVDTESTFAAATFDLVAGAISPSTNNVADFTFAIGNATRSNSEDVNLAAGLAYCGFQVSLTDQDVQRIIVVGSGKFTQGFAPDRVRGQIVPPVGQALIYGVSTAGNIDDFAPLVGDTPGSLFELRGAEDLPRVIAKVVESVCDVRLCDANDDFGCAEEPQPSAEFEVTPSAEPLDE